MNKDKIWYLGYLIGMVSLILLWVFRQDETMTILLTFVFSISVTIAYLKLRHIKQMKNDSHYRILVQDERNEKIRDKVNARMTLILMVLMGVVAVICLSMKAYLPAGLLVIAVVAYPLLSFFINQYYEKRY